MDINNIDAIEFIYNRNRMCLFYDENCPLCPLYDIGYCLQNINIDTKNIEDTVRIVAEWANAIKYLWRWKYKGGKEDLEKSIWYIDRLISTIDGDLNETMD